MTAERRECEKRPPPHSGWLEVQTPAILIQQLKPLAVSTWISGPLRVISSLVLADAPDGSGVTEQWHISLTRKAKRPHPTDVRRSLRAFGLVGAEEDNHHPGNARHFWRPVDASKRVDCECKETDTVVVEKDGYTFSTPADGPCSGCQFEGLTGKRCPLHSTELSP
jgi:hypothetical protein